MTHPTVGEGQWEEGGEWEEGGIGREGVKRGAVEEGKEGVVGGGGIGEGEGHQGVNSC